MLFLFDLAEVAKSSTGKQSPFRSRDLLSAMATKLWAIEHCAVGKTTMRNYRRLIIVQLAVLVKTVSETVAGATALQDRASD